MGTTRSSHTSQQVHALLSGFTPDPASAQSVAVQKAVFVARRLQQRARIHAACVSYERSHAEEFGQRHDHFRLVGQDNFRRYLPVGEVRVRAHPADTAFDLFARVGAAHTAGNHVTVSTPPGQANPAAKLLEELTESWTGAIEFVEETDKQLARVIRERQADRVRYAASDRVPVGVLEASAETGMAVVSRPVLQEGRVELLWYLHEQSLSIDYHRYGNLGVRNSEPPG